MAVSQPSRSRDLDKLLLRPGHLVGSSFEPGSELRDDIKEYVKVLVVGAGGLGCELLKDLALTGFRNLDVIDMDRIEVTNLNRQFLFRLEDVGKPKAEVTAKRVMERVCDVNITPHFCRIEDKPLDFYSDFNIIVLGLDSIEARSYINAVACGFLGAIREQLADLDLRIILDNSLVEWKELGEEGPTGNEWDDRKVGRRKDFLVRRMELAKHFLRTNIDPEWMVLCLLLVLPPELRPIIQIDGGKLMSLDRSPFYGCYEWVLSNDEPVEETVKPMVDGGTEGFKGHARIIIPGTTPCFECTIWLFPPQVKFPLCTLAETPRTAAHCIEYAHLIKWDEVQSGKSFDPDNPEHMQWVYSEAAKRAELFGIPGVTYSLTQGVVKNIIPAIASTNAIISAACALETLKIVSGCSKTLSNYLTYNGVEGLHTKVTEFVKDKDCLVCGPGVLIELERSITLKKFIDQLEGHPRLLLTRVSVTHRGKNFYMQAPPVLEEMTRSNLDLPLFELMGEISKDIIHVNGMSGKGDKKQSCLRKLRVVFKGVDGVADIDMAGGA